MCPWTLPGKRVGAEMEYLRSWTLDAVPRQRSDASTTESVRFAVPMMWLSVYAPFTLEVLPTALRHTRNGTEPACWKRGGGCIRESSLNDTAYFSMLQDRKLLSHAVYLQVDSEV